MEPGSCGTLASSLPGRWGQWGQTSGLNFCYSKTNCMTLKQSVQFIYPPSFGLQLWYCKNDCSSWKAKLGSNHLQTATSSAALAACFDARSSGHLRASWRDFQSAVFICVTVCHLHHSFSLQDLGRSEEAEAFHSKALAAMAACLLSMSSFIMPVTCWSSNSSEFIFQDTLKLLLRLLRRCLGVLKWNWGKELWSQQLGSRCLRAGLGSMSSCARHDVHVDLDCASILVLNNSDNDIYFHLENMFEILFLDQLVGPEITR